MRSRLAVSCATLLVLVLVTACGAPRPTLVATAEQSTVASLYPFADEYFHFLRTAFRESAADGGTQVDVINTNSDAELEAAKVKEALASGVDAVVMQPADSGGGSIATMKAVRAPGCR